MSQKLVERISFHQDGCSRGLIHKLIRVTDRHLNRTTAVQQFWLTPLVRGNYALCIIFLILFILDHHVKLKRTPLNTSLIVMLKLLSSRYSHRWEYHRCFLFNCGQSEPGRSLGGYSLSSCIDMQDTSNVRTDCCVNKRYQRPEFVLFSRKSNKLTPKECRCVPLDVTPGCTFILYFTVLFLFNTFLCKRHASLNATLSPCLINGYFHEITLHCHNFPVAINDSAA